MKNRRKNLGGDGKIGIPQVELLIGYPSDRLGHEINVWMEKHYSEFSPFGDVRVEFLVGSEGRHGKSPNPQAIVRDGGFTSMAIAAVIHYHVKP